MHIRFSTPATRDGTYSLMINSRLEKMPVVLKTTSNKGLFSFAAACSLEVFKLVSRYVYVKVFECTVIH